MTQQLPNSIYDLIEHVELNKSGWWDDALDNVLLAAIWIHGRPVRSVEVADLVFSAFSLKIPTDRVAERIETLRLQGKIDIYENDRVVPANSVADQMEARVEAAQFNENAVYANFVEKIGDYCEPHSPKDAWDLFKRQFLLKLIDVHGARTIQIIGGDEADDADMDAIIIGFVGQFKDIHQTKLRSIIINFLDPDDANVRRYVTEHLDASFLVKASGLTKDAIAGISKFGKTPPTFRLFLDTNFLFSLLNLHENPSNEASQLLGNTIQQVSKHLAIRMHVISPTIDEIKRTLRAVQTDLSGLRMSSVIADAALEVGVGGITMRFARVSSNTGQPISPQEYFDPYLNNLTLILRNKGIEVYNQRTAHYRQRQDVVDDLHEMIGFEGKYESERQRKYNSALHDSILWHFVSDKRSEVFESPLDAVFWVVTNDFKLINFDRKRRRKRQAAAGVCIHPAELVQILRLWEPRTTDMEQALMGVLRLPFMFYEYDSGKEAVSTRILKALSRFGHIDDLKPEAIRDIVLSDAVRSKTRRATSEEDEIEIIHDALLEERKEIVKQRDAAIRRSAETEGTLTEELTMARDRVAEERSGREHAGRRIPQLEKELQEAREDQRANSERVEGLKSTLNERDAQVRLLSTRIRFVWTRGAGVILAAAILAGLGYGWIMFGETSRSIISAGLLAVWVLCVILIYTSRVHGADVSEWTPIGTLIKVRGLVMKVIGTLLLVTFARVLWQELFQPLWFK